MRKKLVRHGNSRAIVIDRTLMELLGLDDDSEVLTILGRMVQDHQIDADLFDVFIRQGVWLDYARQYLLPDQIDAVDLNRIPGYTP